MAARTQQRRAGHCRFGLARYFFQVDRHVHVSGGKETSLQHSQSTAACLQLPWQLLPALQPGWPGAQQPHPNTFACSLGLRTGICGSQCTCCHALPVCPGVASFLGARSFVPGATLRGCVSCSLGVLLLAAIMRKTPAAITCPFPLMWTRQAQSVVARS